MSVLSSQLSSRKTKELAQGRTAQCWQPLTSRLRSGLILALSSNFQFWISHLLPLDLSPAGKWRQLDRTSAGGHHGLQGEALKSDCVFKSGLSLSWDQNDLFTLPVPDPCSVKWGK